MVKTDSPTLHDTFNIFMPDNFFMPLIVASVFLFNFLSKYLFFLILSRPAVGGFISLYLLKFVSLKLRSIVIG